MSVTITDTDLGWDAARDGLESLDRARVTSGLHSKKNATIGWRHEFGIGPPARPWLSIAADQGQADILKTAGRAVGAVADGKPPKVAMTKLGLFVQQEIKRVISENRVGGPALSPATVEAKHGSTKKLVDIGNMIQGIRSEVELGGRVVSPPAGTVGSGGA